MKRAEVVTIPAEKGVPKVEIRKTSGKKSAKTVKKSTTKSAQDKAREKKFAEILESASAGASSSGKTTKKVVRTVPIGDDWPEDSTNDAGVKKKSAAARAGTGSKGAKKGVTGTHTAGTGAAKRAKAKKPNEKITPASIFGKMLKFGKAYQIENEQDFIEAARIYAEEAYLISQMRDQIAEEGLTVVKSYKTGDVPVAHPLLSELPRHVESANKCLGTIGNMISDRGAKKERAARDLDAFRLHR